MATMSTLPYRFFPLLMIILIPLLLFTKRDIGPLAAYPLPASTTSSSVVAPDTAASAEAAAAPEAASVSATLTDAGGLEGADAAGAPIASSEEALDNSLDGPLAPKPGVPHRALNALLPFGTIALATFGGMLVDGAVKLRAKQAAAGDASGTMTLVGMLGESDSIAALIWASALGWLVSMGLVTTQSILSLGEAMDAWIEGMKDVIAPMLVLLLAWALGEVIAQAKAADFLASALHGAMPRWALPSLVAVLAHVISYACGSSFGTMGIILPLVGPLAQSLGGDDEAFLRHCIASVLGGALFGNICSPISDTTILTVLATKCDLHAHVATITPYALLAAALALGLGSLPVGLGWYGPLSALCISTAALVAIVMLAGTPVDESSGVVPSG